MDAIFCSDDGDSEPQPLGEILEKLLDQYEARFPGVKISIVETATAV